MVSIVGSAYEPGGHFVYVDELVRLRGISDEVKSAIRPRSVPVIQGDTEERVAVMLQRALDLSLAKAAITHLDVASMSVSTTTPFCHYPSVLPYFTKMLFNRQMRGSQMFSGAIGPLITIHEQRAAQGTTVVVGLDVFSNWRHRVEQKRQHTVLQNARHADSVGTLILDERDTNCLRVLSSDYLVCPTICADYYIPVPKVGECLSPVELGQNPDGERELVNALITLTRTQLDLMNVSVTDIGAFCLPEVSLVSVRSIVKALEVPDDKVVANDLMLGASSLIWNVSRLEENLNRYEYALVMVADFSTSAIGVLLIQRL